jgi:probable O-glycosylation ligase (exosortase A-associated)
MRVGVRDVILIAVCIVAVPLSLIQPFAGVLFWTWVGYFNPQDFTYGIASKIPFALLIALATMAGLIVTKRKQIPPLTVETGLLVVLWFWFCVTTVNVFFSPTLAHHWTDSVDFLWRVSKILLMVFVALALVTDSKRLRWWYLVTAASFAVFALKGSIFGVFSGGQDKVYGPRNSMIYDNNDFGLAMNMALPMFAAFARTEDSRFLRWAFVAAVPMGIMSVILTYSRGAMLGLVTVLFAMMMKSKRRYLGLLGTGIVTAVVFFIAPEKWIERMLTLKNVGTDQSALARLHSWTFAYRLFLDHPILGGGFQTFTAPLYGQYNMLADRVQGPHSIYFQVLAEHGGPGLVLFLGLIASCFWSCFRLKRTFLRQPGSENLAAYADMVQLGLITFLVSGAFLGRAYFDLLYQLVATVVILKMLARERERLPESSLVSTELSAALV